VSKGSTKPKECIVISKVEVIEGLDMSVPMEAVMQKDYYNVKHRVVMVDSGRVE
jgi:hypothetical protein